MCVGRLIFTYENSNSIFSLTSPRLLPGQQERTASPLGQGMARKRNPFPGETGIHPVCNGHNRLPHPDVTNCKVHNPIIIINSVMKIVIIFIIISLLPCCSDIDSQYFNGEIKEVNVKNVISKNINSTHVPIKGIATGIIAAYDSLLICWSPSYPEHFFNIINIDTGKEIGYFCKKGQGNKEIISTNCISQLFNLNSAT